MKSAATLAATILLAGVWAAQPAHAQLSPEAAAAMSGPILYLPASPSDPGGVNGYDHDRQFVGVEADDAGKNKAKAHIQPLAYPASVSASRSGDDRVP
jgi:hypothetical protein